MAISMIDLTTLEGADTDGKVKAICNKAIRPDPTDPTVPHVGAICVYNDMVATARKHLDESGGGDIPVAAVSTAFPSGRASLEVKERDTKDAIADGATEIDMVIDRGAFLSGDLEKVYSEIVYIKSLCGDKAHLKVILETGELVTYDNVRKASFLAMAAGADFIKTSTGKVAPAATAPVVLVMLEAVRDFYEMTGVRIGVKPAGGIRTTKDAIKQLVLVKETAGEEWLNPGLFRIGASALLNDLLMQRQKLTSGHYGGANYVTLD
jgi:deoxyribose-phosphate aldolase